MTKLYTSDSEITITNSMFTRLDMFVAVVQSRCALLNVTRYCVLLHIRLLMISGYMKLCIASVAYRHISVYLRGRWGALVLPLCSGRAVVRFAGVELQLLSMQLSNCQCLWHRPCLLQPLDLSYMMLRRA